MFWGRQNSFSQRAHVSKRIWEWGVFFVCFVFCRDEQEKRKGEKMKTKQEERSTANRSAGAGNSVQSMAEQAVRIPKSSGFAEETNVLQKYVCEGVFVHLAGLIAQEIINNGREEIEAVLDALLRKAGALSVLEEGVKNALTMRLGYLDSLIKLEEMGVDTDVLNDERFIEFARICDVNMPLSEVYQNYERFAIPREKPVKPVGSALGFAGLGKKEFYTPEEVDRLQKEDFERDRSLLEIVKRSMTKWK